MSQIASINNQLSANPLGGTSTDASTAALLDQRDQCITQLSELMDIRVTPAAPTRSRCSPAPACSSSQRGRQAFVQCAGDGQPQHAMEFRPVERATSARSCVSYANGGSIDLTATGGIKSGKIAAYTELRDKTLVEAQNQLDQFAATLSGALSDKTTAGTAVTSGLQSGFDLNVSDLRPATLSMSPTRTPRPIRSARSRSCASMMQRTAAAEQCDGRSQ